MDVFKIIYTLLGGLGIFFYGMKSMSDALQAIAGEVIKKVINSLTSNRLLAVAVGTIVTCIVQSSSITTVMVVGMVNAGLMKLTQAIGVIYGANIGTTITGWIISIKIGKYGLLLIGLGIFPALFAEKPNWKSFGRALFGVGMVFMGLEIMSDAFKPLRNSQPFLDAISYFAGEGYLNYLASIIVGCILTMVVQSSSAMLGITMALATTGIIPFTTAGALVLGENIGTTITALLASIGANANAKRAARAHAIFNVIGVCLIFSVIPFYLKFVDWFVVGDPNFLNAAGERPYMAPHIASVHTFFNVANTLVFIPFLPYLSKLVTWLTPDNKKEEKHLVVLGNPKDLLPTTAIIQAYQEIKKFRDMIERMFVLAKEYLEQDKPEAKLLAKIKSYEQIADNIQKEITVFLGKAMEKEMTSTQSTHTQALVKIADELESVTDYLERVVSYKARYSGQLALSEEDRKEFFEYFQMVWDFFNETTAAILEDKIYDGHHATRRSEELQILANDMRDRHLQKVSEGKYNVLSSLTFSDMVVALRKIRSHTLNISEALQGLNLLDS